MTEEATGKEQEYISIEDFAKVRMAVGLVTEAEPHPNADRLVVLRVLLGEETRTLVAGMRKWYEPHEFVGKKVIVITNLKPAKLRGVESQGMILAAEHGDDVVLLTVDRDIPPGARVR